MNGMPFFFLKPHAPWEHGTNENTNGLIREYYPKSVDMENFDEGQIAFFIDKFYRRLSKYLGWSPFEALFNVLLHLTTQSQKRQAFSRRNLPPLGPFRSGRKARKPLKNLAKKPPGNRVASLWWD